MYSGIKRYCTDRLVFIAYVFLIPLEGIARKWIFPGFSDIFLVIRDPLAVYILYRCLQSRLIPSSWLVLSFCVGIIALPASIGNNYSNFWSTLYGYRTLFLHYPLVFFIARTADAKLFRFVRTFFVLSVIPLALLVSIQSATPLDSIWNKGVGYELTSSFSASGSLFIRPSGYFSFATVLMAYVSLCYVSALDMLKKKVGILPIFAFLSCFLVAALMVSKTLIFFLLFSSIIYVFSLGISKFAVLKVLALLVFISAIFSSTPFVEQRMTSFIDRWDYSVTEGGGIQVSIIQRILGGFYGSYQSPLIDPLIGVGAGAGTRVGAILVGREPTLALGESDSDRLLNELGIFNGTFYLTLRYALVVFVLLKAFKSSSPANKLSSFLYLSAAFPLFLSQHSPPTILGTAVVALGIAYYLSVSSEVI